MNLILQFELKVSPPFQGGAGGGFLLVREAQRTSFGHPPVSTMLIISPSKGEIFPNKLEK